LGKTLIASRRIYSPRQKKNLLRTIVVGTVIGTFINSLVLLPGALAATVQLGVVRSPDNERQWSGITRRLQSAGVNYCVVDFAQVQQASDLGSTKLLFLPNVAILNPMQVAALQDWMRQGGRVIVIPSCSLM
jgi:hypothetical protein